MNNLERQLELGIVCAFGGGGSSGGGGSTSGTVDYPAYMKTVHGLILDGGGVDTPTNSVIDAINAAYGGSPYAAATAYDPETAITAMETAITAFSGLATALAYHTDYDAIVNAAVAQYDDVIAPDGVYVTDRVAAYTDDLNDALNAKVIPSFRAGMRDIGAVMSSAFTLGEAIITTDVTKQIAKFAADMYVQGDQNRIGNIEKATVVMANMLSNKVEYGRVLAALTVEQQRMKIIAMTEEEERNLEIDSLDAKWDLDLFQYASNVLAGIAGGTSSGVKDLGKSKLSSAMGGALSGAAMGAAMAFAVGSTGGAALPFIAGGAALGLGAGLF